MTKFEAGKEYGYIEDAKKGIIVVYQVVRRTPQYVYIKTKDSEVIKRKIYVVPTEKGDSEYVFPYKNRDFCCLFSHFVYFGDNKLMDSRTNFLIDLDKIQQGF